MEDICKVPGVDIAFIGPGDLATDVHACARARIRACIRAYICIRICTGVHWCVRRADCMPFTLSGASFTLWPHGMHVCIQS